MGFGHGYVCTACNGYNLHQVCARPRRTISCVIYMPTVTFEFCSERPPRGTLCHACGSGVVGYFYRGTCGRFLHPVCANLPPAADFGGTRMRLMVQMLTECSHCRTESDGDVSSWSYVSSSGDRHFHLACVKKMLMASWVENRHNGRGSAVPLLSTNNYVSTPRLISEYPSSSSRSRDREFALRPMSSYRPLMVGSGSSGPFRNLGINQTLVRDWLREKVMEFLRELPWEIVRCLVGDPRAMVADYIASVLRRWASRRLMN